MRLAGAIQKRKQVAALAESQFRDALSRVGSGLEKNADWFLRFCQINVESLTFDAKVTLWHDLLALVVLASRPDASKAGEKLSAMEASSWHYLESWPVHRSAASGTDEATDDFGQWWQSVLHLRTNIQERIESALNNYYPPLQLSNITVQLTPHGLIPVFPLDMFVKTTDSIRGADGAILIRLSLAIQKFGRYLHRCPACNSIFLAARKDQSFCNATCRSRIGMQRWRNGRASRSKRKTVVSRPKPAHRSTHKSKG